MPPWLISIGIPRIGSCIRRLELIIIGRMTSMWWASVVASKDSWPLQDHLEVSLEASVLGVRVA